jgi:predicted peptidase
MIVFLHGSFAQGRDLSTFRPWQPPQAAGMGEDFPFVVVTPQCPGEYDAWPSDLLVDLIDDVVRKYDVDARRVYITGVSLGGRGSWSFACDYPERVAAVVPVCGTYSHPERIHRIKDVPVWAFHGDQDTMVSFAATKKMVDGLKAAGGNVRFTVYEGAGHGISGRVYRTKELYEWLLQQRND